MHEDDAGLRDAPSTPTAVAPGPARADALARLSGTFAEMRAAVDDLLVEGAPAAELNQRLREVEVLHQVLVRLSERDG